jgi:hypothetical protein
MPPRGWALLRTEMRIPGFFCNWKWTPADSSTHMEKLMGRKKEETLTHEKICDLNAGSISPRFFWLTGPAKESEANFWRAFASSEFLAVPMYGEVGKLIDEANKIKYDNHAGNLPTPESISNVLKSLKKIRDITHNIAAALVARVTPQLIDQQHFRQMQYTAHFAGATAGASGFQVPCIVILDTLLGVDYSNLSEDLQETRDENIAEMLPEVVRLVFDAVRPGAKALREFIESVASKDKNIELKTACNAIGEEFLTWRRSHRARAGTYLEASAVTTGRTNGDMGEDVHGKFLDEMCTITLATKATLFELEKVWD